MADKPDSDPFDETRGSAGSWLENAKLVLDSLRAFNRELKSLSRIIAEEGEQTRREVLSKVEDVERDLGNKVEKVERDLGTRIAGIESRTGEVEKKIVSYESYKKGRDDTIVHSEAKMSMWVIGVTSLLSGGVIVFFQWIASLLHGK